MQLEKGEKEGDSLYNEIADREGDCEWSKKRWHFLAGWGGETGILLCW